MAKSPRSRQKKRFICYPNEYWIVLEFNTPGTVDVKVHKKDSKWPIHVQNIKLDKDDEAENNTKLFRGIVIRFCTYFIKRYASHQNSELQLAAEEISAVYTSLGLKIWSRKRNGIYY